MSSVLFDRRRSPRALGSGLLLTATVALSAAGCSKGDERQDLTRFVAIDPGPSIVSLPTTKTPKVIRITVRNVSQRSLGKLRLTVASEACTAEVSPKGVDTLIPGDRAIFSASLQRKASARGQRHPLQITLRAEGLPLAAGVDIVVDLRGERAGKWLDVGQVKLVRRPASGRTLLYLLGGLPILLLVGWMLWRVSHRQKSEEDGPVKPPRDPADDRDGQ